MVMAPPPFVTLRKNTNVFISTTLRVHSILGLNYSLNMNQNAPFDVSTCFVFFVGWEDPHTRLHESRLQRIHSKTPTL